MRTPAPRRLTLRTAALCLLPLWAGSLGLFVNGSSASAQQGPALRHATVRRAGEPVIQGVITRLGARELTVVSEPDQTLPLRDVVAVEFTDRPPQLSELSPLVELVNGDLLAARVISADEEQARVQFTRLTQLPELTIPLEALRSLILAPPADPAARRELRRLLARPRESDQLLLADGDSQAGDFSGLTAETFLLGSGDTQQRVPQATVRAVGFNPELANLPPLKGPGALVTLIDGSRFVATDCHWEQGESLACQTLFGSALTIPVAALSRLHFLGGRARWLSQLEPQSTQFSPYLSIDWPWHRDRNCLGEPLRLRGVDYPLGLGVHSRQSLVFDIAPTDKTFHATLGIDDSAGDRGAALFEVRVDGETRYRSPPLRGRMPPVVLEPIDVSGARTLELLVDYGPAADVLDHADWCEAVLIARPTKD
ncbi:MAG: NPCBM/NEW2 domain-containing protein [Planctomycetaceae bacterium]